MYTRSVANEPHGLPHLSDYVFIDDDVFHMKGDIYLGFFLHTIALKVN